MSPMGHRVAFVKSAEGPVYTQHRTFLNRSALRVWVTSRPLSTDGIGATRIAVTSASAKMRTIFQRIPIGIPPSTTTVCPVTLSARQ